MKAILFAVALAAVTIACSDAAPVTIAPTATETASPTASPQPSLTATATQAPTVVAIATEDPTASASATAVTPPEVRPGDSGGVPFSTQDVRAAVEEGQGYSFWLIEDRASLCPESDVAGLPYWSSNLAGSDFGPVFVLWVYPDRDALQADWEVLPGEAPVPRFMCELPSGFVYWNENLVLAFEVWLGLGEEFGLSEHGESPSDQPAVRGFLELVP